MAAASDRERVALVTGGAQGIGFGIAQALRAAGLRVALADVRETVFKSAEALGDPKQAMGVLGDVSSESDCARVVREAADWGGTVDVLVNCAGLSIRRGEHVIPTLETSLADWNTMMNVNLTGTFLMSRECVPLMKENGWGRVVNISSQAGRSKSIFSGSAYSASKAGMIGFSRILAGEVGQFGVTVNCVAPGRIRRELSDLVGMEEEHAEANRRYLSQIPVGRVGEASDIGGAVAYLVSDAASFVTGTVLDVNGGSWMV